MQEITRALVLSLVASLAQAQDLCTVNPYTREDAEAGKAAFNSHCALCHQFSMAGRIPGNSANEQPDIKTLSADDLRFLDSGGGNVPPLLGAKFFDKYRNSKTLAEFSAFVSSAAVTFPTKGLKVPDTYFQIAAYVLSRNCEASGP